MGKKFVVALALVALMATPALASVQNVKVGGSLKETYVVRNSFDLGANTVTQSGQSVFLSQAALNVQADLTDNVSTMLSLTNERLLGQYNADVAGNGRGGVNIDAAYVTMKEMLYSPLTVTVGRQPLAYGNQFLVGDLDGTNNSITTISDLSGGGNADAIKAVLSYDPLTVDMFAAKISEGTSVAQNDQDDSNLFGVNANYKFGDKMSTVVEAYTFVKSDKTAVTNTNTKTQKLIVPGLRVSTNPIEGLNLQLEGAYQVGNTTANTKIGAYGLQGMAKYAFPVMKEMKPVLSLGYTYLSGDKNTADNKAKAFDPLYENQFGGRIFDSLFTASNLATFEVGMEVAPIQDLTTKLTWYNLSKAQKAAITSINQPTGAAQAVSGTTKKGLGNEVDLDLTYAYTEDVSFGVSAGVFVPGKAFSSANKDSATQILSSVSVAF